MAQPKNPRFNKKSSAFDKRQNLYTAAVHEIFKVCNKEAASLALSTGYDGSKPFSFKKSSYFLFLAFIIASLFIKHTCNQTAFRG